jgi:hypothetical protein
VEDDVVLVDPFAGRDCARGEADDLPVFPDRLSLGDRRGRHLVTARNSLAGRRSRNVCSSKDRIDGDDDIVLKSQANNAGCAQEIILSTECGRPLGARCCGAAFCGNLRRSLLLELAFLPWRRIIFKTP